MDKKKSIIFIIVLLGIVFLIGCTSSQQNGSNNNNSNPPPEQTDTEILIPVNNLSTSAKFYSYESKDGVTIRYFAVKDSSGNIHVAFDACDVCYEAKKGYQQNGNNMKCNNCGKTFPISSIGTENTVGGCWPSYLPIEINGSNIIIKIADLLEKKYMFE